MPEIKGEAAFRCRLRFDLAAETVAYRSMV
jgi:hypothetical protein